MSDVRRSILEALEKDLVGPATSADEVLDSWPSDVYSLGVLYPRSVDPEPEDDDEDRLATGRDGDTDAGIPMSSMRRPSIMGLSFAVADHDSVLDLHLVAARYEPEEDGDTDGARPSATWQRRPHEHTATLAVSDVIGADGGLWTTDLHDGLSLWARATQAEGHIQLSVVLANTFEPGRARIEVERYTWYQVGFRVVASTGQLVPRPVARHAASGDAEINELIYRGASEFAVGHTCAAEWGEEGGQPFVASTWFPTHEVAAMNPGGNPIFAKTAEAAFACRPERPFQPAELATAHPEELVALLRVVPAAYRSWLAGTQCQIEEQASEGLLTESQVRIAERNVASALAIAERMSRMVERLAEDSDVREAFQLAQKAIARQFGWAQSARSKVSGDDPAELESRFKWYPFQLGFQLLAAGGVSEELDADGEVSPSRHAMDLLWFPTGGGKTEAYLGLAAFTLFYRRLRRGAGDSGAGTTILMRYTLRLLTVQQFERAARLVLACDHIRREYIAAGDSRLGNVPFSIGLWVGSAATPMNVADAVNDPAKAASARQLAVCPACGHEHLKWAAESENDRFELRCLSSTCPTASWDRQPIWTIDEDIYKTQPSIVIGTVDKFAQIARKAETNQLFGGARYAPPELIIQDELHLISGPLGTMTALYEGAIDEICTVNGVPPKVVGSTATIRRAEDQVRQLFARNVTQFPPPVLDWDDSCFAVAIPTDQKPGRLYVGVPTVGRSPKFVLQGVYASLLQACAEDAVVPPHVRDAYWTLVGYFNSLRELAGALVMLRDDVEASLDTLHLQHGTSRRRLEDPMELTSRVSQARIPELLKHLARGYDASLPHDAQDDVVSTVLATNMISVGIDIPRLGLMVVNGQPKGMAEYIQATSRVGRGDVAGLVVTLYNAGRPRDRSHYEAFRTWHQTLYRDVEATSVTPFAPRARDRALHASLVSIARHTVPTLLGNGAPGAAARTLTELERIVDVLAERARAADPDEEHGVRQDATAFIERWRSRLPLEYYWDDRAPQRSLLISMEASVAREAAGDNGRLAAVPTPNSMREVEPETTFRFVNRFGRSRRRRRRGDV